MVRGVRAGEPASADSRRRNWGTMEEAWVFDFRRPSPFNPQAWAGISGLQFSLGATWTAATGRNVSLSLLSHWLSARPAALAGLESLKGSLSTHKHADLFVWDPEAETVADHVFHRHAGSPYAGQLMRGRVLRTIARGRTVFADDWRHGARVGGGGDSAHGDASEGLVDMGEMGEHQTVQRRFEAREAGGAQHVGAGKLFGRVEGPDLVDVVSEVQRAGEARRKGADAPISSAWTRPCTCGRLLSRTSTLLGMKHLRMAAKVRWMGLAGALVQWRASVANCPSNPHGHNSGRALAWLCHENPANVS
eukprot:6198970-Pleurochrysis_carterae.AAC.4